MKYEERKTEHMIQCDGGGYATEKGDQRKNHEYYEEPGTEEEQHSEVQRSTSRGNTDRGGRGRTPTYGGTETGERK